MDATSEEAWKHGTKAVKHFDDNDNVDETMKDRNVIEIKVMERGRLNDHDIDDGRPPS